MALTTYCPGCWREIAASVSTCPYCGANLERADARPYGEKLRSALRHPEPQTRLRAAWLLGERRERAALPVLIRILESSDDPYLAAAAAEALEKIGDPRALPALRYAAEHGPAPARHRARLALEALQGSASSRVRSRRRR